MLTKDLATLAQLLRLPPDAGPDVGARLRSACDTLVGRGLPPERVGPMRAWRQTLARFEKLPRDAQRVEMARGLRLVRILGGSLPAAEPPPPSPATSASPSVLTLPGVGPAVAQRLAERRLHTVEDLAWLVPRRYDDLRRVLPLAQALAAPLGSRVTFVATVAGVRASGWRRFLEVTLADGDARLVARWFNVRGRTMGRRFVMGGRLALSGMLREHKGVPTVANAEILGDPDDEGTAARAAIVPRYPQVEGVAPAIVRRLCRVAAARVAPSLIDGLPPGAAARHGLPGLAQALAALHEPPGDLGDDDVAALCRGESPWHRRLAFDELFFVALAVARRRALRDGATAPACRAPPGVERALAGVFPFELTGAQRSAIATIAGELARERPMNRLLQGDVGSGKTAVAFAAAHAAMASGRQVAVMAPTELLAEQHLSTLRPWTEAVGKRCALLTASTPRAVRETTLGMLAAGAIDLVVGTHALLADRVDFSDLGLVVIDEQHRFGVAQRVRLRVGAQAGARERLPHLLVMTATPIPRSLALTIYGDLDVSTLDELPPGRTPPATRVLAGARGFKAALREVARVVDAGGRAFVVCPLVAPSEDPEIDWADATTTSARLAEALAPRRVGLAHGRMSSAERDAAMARLRAGELDVLCATTVIEVGVDVPEARAMVVLDADRFGLAQLHQLRGRVGRGGGASSCLLLTRGARTSDAARRLAIMEETGDGFRIAEEDLAIRGPGEILGVKQAGLPRLRFADLVEHVSLAVAARAEADRLLAGDPTLASHPETARVLEARTAADAVAAEGG